MLLPMIADAMPLIYDDVAMLTPRFSLRAIRRHLMRHACRHAAADISLRLPDYC